MVEGRGELVLWCWKAFAYVRGGVLTPRSPFLVCDVSGLIMVPTFQRVSRVTVWYVDDMTGERSQRDIDGDFVWIKLGGERARRIHGENPRALIDYADLERVTAATKFWNVQGVKGYIGGHDRVSKKSIPLHHVILSGPGPDRHSRDHKNRDVLDNRRDNLAWKTYQEQNQNQRKKVRKNGSDIRSRFRGVSWNRRSGKWRSRIQNEDGKSVFLGYFENELDAKSAFDRAWGARAQRMKTLREAAAAPKIEIHNPITNYFQARVNTANSTTNN